MTALVLPAIFKAIDQFTAPMRAMERSNASFAAQMETFGARGERAFRFVGNGADKLFNKVVNLKNLAIAGGIGILVKQAWDLAGSVAEVGDELGETSKRLGINVEWLQKLRYAAKLHNVESETLTNSIGKLNKNLGDLQRGTGSVYAALKKSNPALLRQLKHTKDSEAAFNLVLAEIDKMPTAMAKASAAQIYFGKSGAEMINLIADGPKGLQDLMKEAESLGIVLSKDAVDAAMKFGDSQDKMSAAIQGVKMSIGGSLMPVVMDLMGKLTNWIAQNRELIQTKVTEWAQKISEAIQWVSRNIDDIIKWTKLFGGALLGLKAVSIIASGGIYAINSALFMFNLVGGFAVGIAGTALPAALETSKVAMYAHKAATWISTFFTGLWTAAQGLLMIAVDAVTGSVWFQVVAAKAQAFWSGAVTKAIWLWEAAQWAINVALTANPIGAIIMAIAALIALIVAVIVKWDEWGAAVSLFMGPIGLVISAIQSFRKNWHLVSHAFKTDGIMGALKAIGKVLLDVILYPLQQILEIAGRIPGKMGAWARQGAANIAQMRESMGIDAVPLDQKTDEQKKTYWDNNETPYPQRNILPAVNPKKEQNDAIVNKIMTLNGTVKQKTELTIKMPPGMQAEVTKNEGGKMPKVTTTLNTAG